MTKYKNILLPLDFSSFSDNIFYFGCMISRHEKATLHLIHVIDLSYQSESIKDEFLIELRFKTAREELNKFTLEIPHEEVAIKPVIKYGNLVEEILTYSKQNKIDLVLINNYSWKMEEYSNILRELDHSLFTNRIPVIFFSENNSHSLKHFLNFRDNRTAKNNLLFSYS